MLLEQTIQRISASQLLSNKFLFAGFLIVAASVDSVCNLLLPWLENPWKQESVVIVRLCCHKNKCHANVGTKYTRKAMSN